MPVATKPVTIIIPNFLVHHTSTDKTLKPIKSQRIGIPVAWKNIGEKMEFSTPHRDALMDMVATSQLPK
jgi:hypothetical protein